MADVQHCPTCDEEYVGGVPACVDCGGPLTPGPLQRYEGAVAPTADPAPPSDRPLGRLLARLPGKQADQVVRLLLMENIPCRVLCEGQQKTYAVGQPPSEPFAVSLPVEIFVAAESFETAQEILSTFEHDDLIGEQWNETAGTDSDSEPEIPLPVVSDNRGDVAADDFADAAPQAQGTSMVTAVLVVAVILGLLFLFGR